MLTVACVYKSGETYTGGGFDASYVIALRHGLRKHLHLPHRFLCLTDRQLQIACCGFESKKLQHPEWPGWWAKMELYLLPGPVLYLDLDTVITDDITPLAEWIINEPSAFLMLKDFYCGWPESGLLGWRGNHEAIYRAFVTDSERATWRGKHPGPSMQASDGRSFLGDARFLAAQLKGTGQPITLAQDICPGIVSYKVDVQGKGGPPKGTRIVCFHGLPRPKTVAGDPWMHEAWNPNQEEALT